MIVHLSDIFFFLDHDVLENNINKILDKYSLDNTAYHLFNDDKFLIINDPNGNQYIETVLSGTKRSYFFIDVINILLQFYIRQTNRENENCHKFIKDCAHEILAKTNIHSFQYLDFYAKESNSIYIEFLLYKHVYLIEAKQGPVDNGIYSINIFIKHVINGKSEWIDFIKNKPTKIYGNVYMSVLYQMMLFTHYILSYIKDNSTWDSI